ncbi:MAG TPA: S9 family peptidase, partial [Pyrinomonadaceae bacterium]|nr:S9 family peptidase [Pyrinomonadaceae bacterium]
FLYDLNQKKIRRLTSTQAFEAAPRFLDDNRIIYSQSGNYFILDLNDSSLKQITREANPQNNISVGSFVVSKNGAVAAYVVTDSSKQRQLVVPNFLPEYVTGQGPRRGWTEQKLFVAQIEGEPGRSFEVKLPKAEGVSSFRSIKWAADNRSLIVDRLDRDTKRRQLFFVFNVGAKNEKVITIEDETDPKWQAPLSAIYEPHPTDAFKLFFCSEKDGFNHIYLAEIATQKSDTEQSPQPAGEVKIAQLTKGQWQVEWAKWLPDNRIIYLSTEATPTEREFYTLDLGTNVSKKIETGVSGFKQSAELSEDKQNPRMIFSASRWDQPDDVYSIALCNNCNSSAVRLTDTVPQPFKAIKWTPPQFIKIPSRDGKTIPAKIYLPNTNSSIKKGRPMVIFVHGAGYLQNVINGWNNYYREFMFNELLVDKGWVVLDIDYRGSAGYGRDWRTDVYDFLGGKDFDDHIDAIDYMIKNYNVDQSRIAVYGGSYGGFMSAMLVLRSPDKIAAAAALRPVMDWKNYYTANPFYTAQRLGMPDKNPEAYKRSSPIAYADKLEKPLLILHGMVDDNVHLQDSVQMVEKLIRLGKTKYFEIMFYPSENHGFIRPESWTDEYERILSFFEKYLK